MLLNQVLLIPLKLIAEPMLRKHIHRILIAQQGKLCGTVTTMDMLKVLLSLAGQFEEKILFS